MKWIFCTLIFIGIISCSKKKTTWLSVEVPVTLQKFLIDPLYDTMVTGSQGTLLYIPANSFIDENGKEVKSTIELMMNEFYSTSDFIKNRLSTSTLDNKILRSSGMVFIEGKSDSQIIQIKKDSPLTIMFNRIQNSKTANLFLGEKASRDEMRWKLLKPVHNDTIVVREDIITRISYGQEKVEVNLKFIIGKDTILSNDQNKKEFENIVDRFRSNNTVEGFESIVNPSAYNPERFYIFQLNQFGWINCDIFIEEELIRFAVNLSNNNSDVFMVVDSLNAVLFPDSLSNNTYFFSVPVGKPVSIAAYEKENNEDYFDLVRTTTSARSISMDQKKTSLDKIREQINQLK